MCPVPLDLTLGPLDLPRARCALLVPPRALWGRANAPSASLANTAHLVPLHVLHVSEESSQTNQELPLARLVLKALLPLI